MNFLRENNIDNTIVLIYYTRIQLNIIIENPITANLPKGKDAKPRV